MRQGNLGDCKPVGEGVAELRVDYGPGYRVYFGQKGRTLVVLLCGGTNGRRNAISGWQNSIGTNLKRANHEDRELQKNSARKTE